MVSQTEQNTASETFRIILECPHCLKHCSPADEECPGCGFRFRPAAETETARDRTIHVDPASKKRYTTTVTVDVGSRTASRHRFLWAALSLLLGFAAVAIGAFVAYAMPFGFECGMMFLFLGGLLMLNVYLTSDIKYKRIDGACPHCGADLSITMRRSKDTKTDRCQKCRKAIHFTGSRFEAT